MMQKCNPATHRRKVHEAYRMRKDVPYELRPLFNHIIHLSNDSSKHGYCQRAGIELRAARKLASR